MRATSLIARTGCAGRVAVATGVVAIASWVGVITINYGQLTAIWPANGVLLAFVLTAPQKRWPAYLAGGFMANLAVGLVTHDYGYNAIMVAVANAIEVYIAALPFRKSSPSPPDLGRSATLLRFAAFACLLAPMSAAAWVVFTNPHFMENYPLVVKLRNWYLGDSLGILLCVPLTLALLNPGWKKNLTSKRLLEIAGLLGISTLVSFFVCRNESFPFPFVVLVVLIPVTFRLGLASSAFGVLLISFPASYYTFLGKGPLARATPLHWGLYLQLYFLILLVTVYVLSTVREEEKRLADDLRSSETRYRVLAETSQDLILRTTLDGFRTYVSPSVRGVTGWTEDELPPPSSFAVLIHPADRSHFLGFLEKLRSQPGSHTLVYRARRRDGQYGWLEASVGTVYSEIAIPCELVWTIRDISLRIEHEETLKSEKQAAQELAWTDGLTGLSNRRAFDERLLAEWIFSASTMCRCRFSCSMWTISRVTTTPTVTKWGMRRCARSLGPSANAHGNPAIWRRDTAAKNLLSCCLMPTSLARRKSPSTFARLCWNCKWSTASLCAVLSPFLLGYPAPIE